MMLDLKALLAGLVAGAIIMFLAIEWMTDDTGKQDFERRVEALHDSLATLSNQIAVLENQNDTLKVLIAKKNERIDVIKEQLENMDLPRARLPLEAGQLEAYLDSLLFTEK